MSISFEEVQHAAKLARLELDEVELLAMQGELNALLGHFEDFLLLDDLAPELDSPLAQTVLSDDSPLPGLRFDEAVQNAAVKRAGLFILPSILDA